MLGPCPLYKKKQPSKDLEKWLFFFEIEVNYDGFEVDHSLQIISKLPLLYRQGKQVPQVRNKTLVMKHLSWIRSGRYVYK